MEAIVLAGGLGTRLRAAVPGLPKPLAPVAGRPFLEHLLDHWTFQGVTRAVLAVGHMQERIAAHFGANYRGCAIDYSVEYHPLGTGGALLAALPLLRESGPFLVLNGDTYFAVPLAALAAFHGASRAEVTLSLFRSAEGTRYAGVSLDETRRVTALGGNPDDGAFANGGVFMMEREALAQAPPPMEGMLALEAGVLAPMLDAGRRVFGYVCDAAFVDIGVPEDWRAAERIITGAVSAPRNH